ncbi:MAG: ArnT family glycosyltransferase [Anaerolineales bacterium]
MTVNRAPNYGWISGILPYLVLAFLSFAVIIQIAPHFDLAPRVDSSIFIYMGRRVLQGDIPYKDMWDHKGPLIYYINALGLVISDGSRWGILYLELVAVITATLVGFSLFKRAFGLWPAFFAATLFVIELRLVLDKGNMTEEYALPLQMLMLWLIWYSVEKKQVLAYFCIGVLAGLCFLLRPNIIGIPLAFGLILLWQSRGDQRRDAWRNIAVAIVGGLLVIGWVAIYFLFSGALPQMWDAMFMFNFLYNAGDEGGRLAAVIAGFQKLPVATAFGTAGWVLAVLSPVIRQRNFTPARVLVLMIAIGLPLEIALTSISGFFFTHYYMSWLPILALSAGFVLYSLYSYMTRSIKGLRESSQISGIIISPVLLLVLFLSPVMQLLPGVQETFRQAREAGGLPPVDLSTRAWIPVVIYATENLDESDPFLVWGNEAKLNWLADRHPSIPFFYQTPLLVDAYMTVEKANELIEQMEANPPTILDTGPPGGFMPSLSTPLDELPEDLKPLYQYFQENYEYAGTFDSIGWDLYLYHGNGVPLDRVNQAPISYSTSMSNMIT